MQRALRNAIAGLALVLAGAGSAQAAQGHRWGEGYFPNLPVVTQDGTTLRFYDDLIKGKIVVISFIYTRCTDLCPLSTARLAEVKERLSEDAVGRSVFFISMSVDPEHDTPADLKFFADAYHSGPGWQFITGRPEDLRAIETKLGNTGRKLSEHRNQIVLGNDATGEWERASPFGDLEPLVMAIRALDPKWREQVREPRPDAVSDTGYRLSTAPGEVMFAKLCAPCHAVGAGTRVGPDLRGVAQRREHAWLARFMRNPEAMIAEQDPIAVALAAQYKGAHMPNMGLTEDDAGDLITYLTAETARLAAAQSAAATVPDQAAHQH
jgi:protein SCO1